MSEIKITSSAVEVIGAMEGLKARAEQPESLCAELQVELEAATIRINYLESQVEGLELFLSLEFTQMIIEADKEIHNGGTKQ